MAVMAYEMCCPASILSKDHMRLSPHATPSASASLEVPERFSSSSFHASSFPSSSSFLGDSCSPATPSSSRSLRSRITIGGSGRKLNRPPIGVAGRNPSRIPIGGDGRNPKVVAEVNPSRPAISSRPSVSLVSGRINARPAQAAITETAAGDGLKWWERGGAPNISDVHNAEEFLGALSRAGDRLVVVEFYATWCGSCRALYPKFCQIATDYSDAIFLKVNFDENKPMCKSLMVKVLPFFHIYRGREGRLDSFSCSLSKIQKLKDAIAKHHDCVGEECAVPEPLDGALGPIP